jgi:hypothetical protein
MINHPETTLLVLGDDGERARLAQCCASLLTEELAVHTKADEMPGTVQQIVARLLPLLRPDLFEEIAIPACPGYDCARLPQDTRMAVLEHLAALIPTWIPIIARAADPARERQGVACLLVDTILARIDPDVLDTPVPHASAVALAVAHADAYLLRVCPMRADPDRAAQEILSLVVNTAAAHLLADGSHP